MAINYKVKSAITVGALVLIMVTVGLLMNRFQGGITGAVTSGIACSTNEDCNDGVGCTIDSCKNPNTEASFCSNQPVDFCQSNDGCCPAGCTAGNDQDC